MSLSQAGRSGPRPIGPLPYQTQPYFVPIQPRLVHLAMGKKGGEDSHNAKGKRAVLKKLGPVNVIELTDSRGPRDTQAEVLDLTRGSA